MMGSFILIVVLQAKAFQGQTGWTHKYPIVTMQRFDDLKACQHASRELSKLVENQARMVCVPESIANQKAK